ncbi:MAG TPA: tail fiber protein [Saprospiraceae bacterium]|nr:tail fiber protein [Saprospiraceae bacterium]HNM26973.1 tail fiber protein [Saprospiraceae bacterium]
MSEPYIGEIRMFAGNFAPLGWAFCNGALMPISENEVLFQVIGTTYGGDGQETFALPDLQGRIPVHNGNSYVIGESAGVEYVTLTSQQMPSHTHTFAVSGNTASSPNPGNNFVGLSSKIQAFYGDIPNTLMNPNSITPVGGNQPHGNFMPYLCINFIISLFGIFPSPN